MSAPRLPAPAYSAEPQRRGMVAVRCRDCISASNAAEVLTVDEGLHYAVVPKDSLRPWDGTPLVCAPCPSCGRILCIVTERRRREVLRKAG